ncbi:hypothetical protein BK666_05180 [Pseudomonas frederiksbergensis]|uniref:Serine protease n=1 Tax=Pseudomonas frederiksbergensis TaxID=104087 RepID=A0A423KDW6_9PSED|nr:hypothetical protein [Pseudomonas frederiksbergensis]RON50522.1 hypothetical protein BK666_05180 [Pseudomonas frederiksbergensis]
MPASFEQYLRLEIAKLPHIGPVRVGHDAGQQLDHLSVADIVAHFRAFIALNYSQALQGEIKHQMDVAIAALASGGAQEVRVYDLAGARPTGAATIWQLLDESNPRQKLVNKFCKLSETLAVHWKAIVAPVVEPVATHKGRVRPMKPGYSVGRHGSPPGAPSGAGTIGGFIRSKGGFYLLSNAHVLTANPFDPSDSSKICQPGPGDGGSEIVARVSFHCPLLLDGASTMDAAIALITPSVSFSYEYEGVGPLTGIRDPRVGETLTLVARTTRLMKAVVQLVDADTEVANFVDPHAHNLAFRGVTVLKNAQNMYANLAGDSGGMWIGEDNKAVALNFAGGEDSDTAFAIPIPRILAYFQDRLGDPKAGLVGIDNATLWR